MLEYPATQSFCASDDHIDEKGLTMIIKEKDPIDLEQLEAIVQLPNLSDEKLSQAQRELKILKSGVQGEENSA